MRTSGLAAWRACFALGVLAAASAGAVAAAEPAKPPPGFEAAFSGAFVSTYPDGSDVKLWLDPQGAYRALDRHQRWTSGSWRLRPGKLCMNQEKPFPIPFLNYCTPLPADMKTPWRATAALTGEPISVVFMPGLRP